MISLYNLLLEAINEPKAIILAGAPGAGKSSILKDLDLSKFTTLNIDDTIASLSKKQGFTLNQKAANAEDRSKFMKAMRDASSELTKDQIPKLIQNKVSFILDGTAASTKNTLELKNNLEKEGYKVFMLYVYTDLENSLNRNNKRFEKSGGTDRSLIPSSILGTWKSVTQNFPIYQKEFSPNFISVSNTGKDESLKDIEKIIDKYVTPYNPKDPKPKTEKEQEQSKKQKDKLNKELQLLLNSSEISNIINNSVSKEEAQTKINQFIK